MLYHTQSLAVVDYSAHLADEVLRIHPKLLEFIFPVAFQDVHYGSACQSCPLHQFAHKVIFYGSAYCLFQVDGLRLSLFHGCRRFKLFAVGDFFQLAAFHSYHHFSHKQSVVNLFHSLFHQVCRLETHVVVSAFVYSRP